MLAIRLTVLSTFKQRQQRQRFGLFFILISRAIVVNNPREFRTYFDRMKGDDPSL